MTFGSIKDMTSYLSQYRAYYYKWLALKEITDIRSPSISGEPAGSFSPSREYQMLKRISDRDDIELRMKSIADLIDQIHDLDYLSWTILTEKFIYFRTLEEIADMLHYSHDHMRHCLYPKAKQALFEHHTE